VPNEAFVFVECERRTRMCTCVTGRCFIRSQRGLLQRSTHSTAPCWSMALSCFRS